MSYRYDNATDKFIHIADEKPIFAEVQYVMLSDECINRIAEAVVQKIKDGEADET